MNRNNHTITLRSLMSGADCLGSVTGRRIQPALIGKVGTSRGPELVRVSLSGIRQIDVTFARETIIAMVQYHLRHHGICLTQPTSADVVDNIAAAAERAGVPVTVWRGDIPEIVGPPPSGGAVPAFKVALAQSQIRAAGLAQTLGISLTNASTKLKQLWDSGYLMRDEVASATGGNEFVYSRIG
jgi:hypothetical protein